MCICKADQVSLVYHTNQRYRNKGKVIKPVMGITCMLSRDLLQKNGG